MRKIFILLFFLISAPSFSQDVKDIWKQLGSDIDGESAGDNSGWSVSMSSDGTIVAIGAFLNNGNGTAAGHVRVYQYSSGNWSQLGSDIDGEAVNDESGFSVSMNSDGTIVAIGARYNDGNGSNAGHVRVYQYASGSWTQLGSDIDGEAPGDEGGYKVSMNNDGTIVAIGAILNDGNGTSSGHVRVYQYSSGSWTKLGSDIDGETAGDYSGYSVSLSSDGTIVAIGALYNDGNGTSSGHVRVYQYSSGSWTKLGSDIDGEAAGDRSGYSVSMSSDGTIVAIGAYYNDGNGTDAGHVRVYKYTSGNWSQVGSDIDGEAADDRSGSLISLSSDGTILAIGAYANDGNGSEAGHVRVYKNVSDVWTKICTCGPDGGDIDGEAAGDRNNKVSISSDGTKLAIGSYLNDGNGTNAGHVRVYEAVDLTVTLSVANTTVAESVGAVTVTATLNNAAASCEVTVDLSFSGTATGGGTDYRMSSNSITISAGTTSGTTTLTVIDDIIDENDETVIIDILSVTNATESGTQQATVTITDNDIPTASDVSATTPEDTSVDITLVGTGAGSLTYSIVTNPTNGTVSLSGSTVTYTPNANYNGSDSFTYKVNTGVTDSNVATASITITPVNDAPVTSTLVATTNEDTPVDIDIVATDVEGDALTYVITTNPTNGTLAMTGSVVTYTPNVNYNGSDSFSYRVNDGTNNSNATVPITVNPINDPPVSSDKTVTTNEDVSLPIDVTATDVEGNGSINYTIVSAPTNGSVSIAGNIATYIPSANYNGTDSFTYKANDGTDDGNTATVSITITAVDDASVAQPQSITTNEDTPKSFNLIATEVDGDALTYSIASASANGTVTLSGNTATYTPDPDYNGSDSFQFSVNDGTTTTTATVSITVTPVDDISVAEAQVVSTNEDTPIGINLIATNVDGDALTYSILTNPTNGTLTLVGSTVTYTPNANYNGPDSFTWSVNDGTTTTSAIVTITVLPINDPPVASDLVATTNEDTPVNVTLVATDIEGDPITYNDPALGIGVIGNPKNGRASLSGTTLTYTPNANYNGVDLLTYRVAHIDCSGITCSYNYSNTANISITVLPINDAPVASDITVTTNEDTPVDITLLVTDADADEINYNILTSTTNGTITISDGVVTYIPKPDYCGPDSFTYNGYDGGSTLSLGGADGTFEALASVAMATNDLRNSNVTGGGWLNGEETANSHLSPVGLGTPQGYADGMPSSPDGGVFAGVFSTGNTFQESFFTTVDSLQIGTQYTVSFFQANAGQLGSNVNEVDNIQVTFGSEVQYSPAIPFLGFGNQVWSEVSLVFTASATSQRLEFYNIVDAGIISYMAIDGITITTPNPNPLISNTATVTINVLCINDPPIVVKDTFYINEQDTLIVTILDPNLIINNDTDVDNPLADLSAVIHIPPIHHAGIFTLGNKGQFEYIHDCNDSDNEDYIIYYVNDGDLNSLISDTAIIYILNEAPFGEPDFYSVQNSQTLNIDAASGPILNDVDSNSCDVLNVILVQPPTQHVGTFVLDPNGAFNYIHDGTVIPDQDYFVYQLNDAEDNAVETDTVYISIVNPPPTAVAHYYAVDEGKQLVVDSTQGLLIGAVSPLGFAIKAYIDQPPSNGVLLPAGGINTNGSFVYEHDCSDTPGQDFFTFTVVDSAGRSDPPDTVYITINNVCPNGNNDEYTVTEGETIDISLDFGVLVNDLDDNPCDPLSVNLVTPPLYHNGGFVLNSDGSFIYTHDDSENFEDQFSYRLSDGECMGAVYTVTIIVDPVDDKPPIANNDLIPTCVDEGGSFTIATYAEGVLGNDIDPDVKDSILTAILVDPPMYGDLIFNSDGTFTYTHDGGDEISDAFTYICNDGDFNSLDTATVSICINPINDCPVAEDDIFLINEGDILDSSLVFNDSDPDTFEEDFLITTVVTPPAIGILELKSDGTFKYFSPSQVPLPGPEIVTFVYKLSDGTCEVTANVTITINSINDCPVAEDDTITVNALDYDTIIKDLIMNDYDIDSPLDSTSIEIINPPHWGDYIVNGDGTISYIYTGSPTKKDSLTYWVRDSEGCYSNEATLLIYIENIQFPEYQLPDYFTPNADRFNDYFVIKLKNITLENVKFEVLILDRYQRKVFESTITGDEIWDGMNQFTGGTVKKDFYYYQITPIEYGDTKARTIVGVLLLDR